MKPPYKTPLEAPALIIHAGALGDCVLSLHFAEQLRKAGHGAVHLASRNPFVQFAHAAGACDGAYRLDAIGSHRWFGGKHHEGSRYDEFLASFDPIVSFLGGPDDPVTATLSDLSGRTVIGIDPRPELASVEHITAQWAGRLWGKGVAAGDVFTAIRLAQDRLSEARKRLVTAVVVSTDRADAQPKPVALIHPGSGGKRKCSPLRFLDGLVHALRDAGWLPAWMVGPDEIEREGLPIVRRLEAAAPVLFEESVVRASEWVAAADAYIGHDAGMTHVAAILGVRTVAVFGPTDPRVWRPLGPNVTVVPFPREPASWAGRILESLRPDQPGRA